MTVVAMVAVMGLAVVVLVAVVAGMVVVAGGVRAVVVVGGGGGGRRSAGVVVVVSRCSLLSEASRSTHSQHVETACCAPGSENANILHISTGHISCKYKHMTMMTVYVYTVCVYICIYIYIELPLHACCFGVAVRARHQWSAVPSETGT